MSLLATEAASTRRLYKPGEIFVGNRALISPGETDSSGNGTVLAAVTRRTRVVPRICGNAPAPEASVARDKFCPLMEIMLPGAGDMYGLNVTPSTTEFASSDGAFTAVTVNVTERPPLAATS